jgi:monofunctional glycosyltransferase
MVVPPFAVLLLRWVDPPITWTMVEARWAEGSLHQVSLRLEDQGEAVPRGVLTAEDQRFYLHHGFDWEAICSALEDNLAGGRLRGGSTLSQQVARNVFLWQGRTWFRKGLEAMYTAWLELLLPKDRILEIYLNVAQTGPSHFGVESGAQHWYGRSASRLSANQAARLAAILPAPSSRLPGSAEMGRLARKRMRIPAPIPGDAGFDRWERDWADRGGVLVCFR